MRSSSEHSWLSDLFFLALLFGLFYAAWSTHPLFTPDEGRYSEVAREMIASSDYITPRLNGVAFLDKPVLYYWLQATAIHLFGLKEWALRFWPSFMGVLGSLITYMAGRILFNRRTGLLAATILATSPLYYGAAHYANLDLEVASFIGCSLLFFITAMQYPFPSFKRSTFLMAAFMFAGFAALTKGLIGLAFPVMIIGAWILLLNRWDLLKKIHLVSGLILFAVIVVPWYLLVQKANPEFFHFFFVTQQFSRFLTKGDFNNKAAWWFYAPVVLLGIFPWTVFAIQALFKSFKNIFADRKQYANELFLVLWIVIVFTFFSIPKSKTVGYILPLFPALALLIGNYLSNFWEKTYAKNITRALWAFIVLTGITAAGFIIAPHLKIADIPNALIPYLNILAIILVIGLFAGIFLLKKTHLTKVFSMMLVISVSFLLCLSASTAALNTKSIKPLAKTLNTILKPNDELVTFYKFYYDLPIYTQRKITIVADWSAPDIAENDNWVRELWYGMPFQNTQAWLIENDTFKKRWESNKRLFVVTDINRLPDFKSLIHDPIYTVAKYNTTIILSNQPRNS